MKILVVDDSKAMRMIVTRTVKQAGFSDHTFIEAGDGKEALEVIQQQTPDFVLSDWNMPEMKGIELLRELRSKGNPIKFGFITSESSPEVVREALDAGASFLITKPFTPERFRNELTAVLA
ncbi:MAG TPA: response regulator [Pirellulaceae bacterium]|nr:response regulator [Pirellulaceae bacterium]HMO91615.1 response regulator [Pirellulaceae bacterium]HMP68312.1 response regulator [Pirellulaceae bacterium]